MKIQNFTYLIISLICLSSTFSFASFNQPQTENQKHEKVFLHLDKNYYFSGTVIRYSAYVVDEKTHKPSNSSSVLDVQIIDLDNNVVASQKVLLKNGKSAGKLELEKSIPTANYLLIAYTRYSDNNNYKNSFKQKVRIVNPKDEISSSIQNNFKADFYPEGGQLIGGHLNSVAFKINKLDNDWKGVVVSNSGDTVALIEPYKLGYGHFSLFVNKNSSYRAKIETNEGQYEFGLPKVQNDKVTGRIVNFESDTLTLITNIGIDFSGNQIGMLVYNNGEVILGTKQIVRGRRMIFKVPKKLLRKGLNTLYLYNEDQEILSERNYYKNEKRKSNIELKINPNEFKKNEKISLKIKLDTLRTQALVSNASFSIKNLDYFDTTQNNDMNMYFNMFSFLNILDPSSELEELSQDNLFTDIYLKTKSTGIKKVNELMGQEESVSTYNSKDYFTVSGTVTDKNSNIPIQDSVIYCSVLGQIPQFYASKTDDQGRFYFQLRSFFGESDVVLKVANVDEKQNNLKYELDNNIIKVEQFGLDDDFSINEDKLEDYLTYHKQNELISRVYNASSTQVLELENQKRATGFFPNYSDSKDLTEYEFLKNFQQLSRELLPGLAIKNEKGVEKIYLREIDDSGRNSFIGRFENEPLFLIDGLPVFNNNFILNYSTAKIKFLSLINKRYFINGVFQDGILELGTRDSDYYKMNNTNHHWFTLQGFYKETNKLNPDFTEINENDKLPDFRDVLYWNSNYKIISDEENEINFSTSDDIGSFLIEMHGIDQFGNIYHHKNTIIVD
ncbi:hypothetical protein ABWH96_09095 [Marivirga tractuosa]|uniref:hypothetical protein n=1 Tax=Marivirga tractuosa TaxID=1006 RepID=UPI0035CECD1F